MKKSYQPLGYVNTNDNKKWISKLGYDESNSLIALPIENNGTNITHMTDSYQSYSGKSLILVGGGNVDEFNTGLWSFYHASSNTNSSTLSARLLRH